MNVIAQLGEPYWRIINARTITLTLPERSSVATLLSTLCEQYPALTADLREGEVSPAIFVGDVVARADTLLEDGAQIHIVWPVSGG